jgi:phage terminase Nu1 subunit (DNA packaging protein)
MSTWMKDKEMAAHFRVSVKTITRWAKRGMPRVREGNVVLYPAEDCDNWLRARTGTASGPDRTVSSPPRRPGRPRRVAEL